jgi:hypothetical protein
MSFQFIERYEKALNSNSLSLDVIREYLEGVGNRLDSDDHLMIVELFDDNLSSMSAGIKEVGRYNTNTAVGGDFRLLNWVVAQALEYAADARCRPSKKGAEDFHNKAKILLAFADSEIQRLYGTKDGLANQWNIVNEPLPDYKYPLD